MILGPLETETVNEGLVNVIRIRNLGTAEARCQVNILGEWRIAPGAIIQLPIHKRMVEIINTGKTEIEIVTE